MSILIRHPGTLAKARSALGAARIGLRLTIRRKILLAFLCMGGITASLGAYAVFSIAMVGHLTEQTFDGALMSISYARAASADFAGIEAATARLACGIAPADQAILAAQTDDLSRALDDDLAIAGQRSLSPQAAQAAADAAAAIADWRMAAGLEGGAGSVVSRRVDALAQTVNERFELLINHAAGDGFRFRQRAREKVAQAKSLALLGTGVAVLLAVVVAVLLARRIVGPVAAASAAASRIAAGQLDTYIPVAGTDELGALLAAMAVMRANIAAMMAREVAERRSAQACLTDAIEGSSEGVMVVDGSGAVAVANTRMGEYLRTLRAMPAERSASASLTDNAPLHALMSAADSAGETCLPDGRWLRISRSSTRDGGFVAICSDITARKQHEAALELANTGLDAALNNMAQGLCMFDSDHRLRLINRRFCDIFQLWPAMPAIGTSFRTLFSFCADAGAYTPAEANRLYESRVAQIAQGAAFTQILEMGRDRVVSIVHQPMPDGGWVATYENITDRVRAEEKVSHMARHDALTGLPNRAALRETMEAAVAGLEHGGAFAALFIDLDHFRAVNETLGFPAGDQVLREVAARLSGCLRRTEAAARLGAHEFAVMASGLQRPEDASEVARRVSEAVSAPFAVDGHEVVIGTCIGIVMAPTDGAAVDALLRKADLALDRAKQDGRGTVCFFEPEMDARQQARRKMETGLRTGLARREFELLYQPLFDLRENRVCGFESLIRWNHPSGRVSPGEFIPVAEDTGLIVQIGEWTLTQACAEAAAWPDNVKVAVNVSPIQFRSPNLVSAVKKALARSGLAAARLELEITESVLMADSDATLATLHQLRALGLRISMDDFGTGFSSLSYLRSFPFDKIKIDQSFVRDLTARGSSGGNAQAIVRAITGLGSNLGMRTTAEGVETLAQLDRVRSEGCSEIQGYLLSRPVPAKEVAGLIRKLGLRSWVAVPA
jgi:diguanylate cyclase (GGDEF)-like protein